jgi:hypothetical protein
MIVNIEKEEFVLETKDPAQPRVRGRSKGAASRVVEESVLVDEACSAAVVQQGPRLNKEALVQIHAKAREDLEIGGGSQKGLQALQGARV